MSYVPGHLEFNRRQIDGWPEGITSEGKEWATKRITALLSAHRHVPLWLAVQTIFEAHDRPEDFQGKAAFAYQNATADRALRAADGEQVWVPDKWHTRRRFRFHIGDGKAISVLNADAAKLFFANLYPSPQFTEAFENFVNRGQVGDVFQIPNAGGILVVCSDEDSVTKIFEPSL